jgi:F0F1-type ATP synthase gamma subunit
MTKAELKKFSEAVITIKSITRVYEQAAARKMKMVKMEIENIAEYLNEATNTYSSSKYAITKGEKPKVRQAVLASSFRRPAKKQVLVLIASQTQYYGNLIPSLFREFMKYYQKTGSDAVVLGKIGKDLMEKNNIVAQNITYWDFDDASPAWNVVHEVAQQLADYAQIIVFYGQYKSVLTQEAKSSNLAEKIIVREVKEEKQYLFRPQPQLALSFLEKQMIAGGFLEKIYESQVAKYAARIKILEIGQVAEKISSAMDDLARGRRNFRKNSNNRKQQQLFTGSDLWQNEGLGDI